MSIISYLEEVVDDRLRYTQDGKEVHFNCLMGCGDTRGRMYVNLDKHTVYCHNCGYSGTIIKLVRDLERLPYEKALERYKEIKGSAAIPEDVRLELSKNLFIGDLTKFIEKRSLSLPEEYIKLNFKSKNPTMKRAISYLRKRGITRKQIEEHGFGVCLSGKYSNRIIIPLTEFGEVKFYIARAIGSGEKLKEKSPTNEFYQVSKSQVLFNIDRASFKYRKCVLCEGIFDALSFGDIGVALLGKRLSDEQLAILLDYREVLTEGVYIALDYDAKKSALEIAQRLSEYFKVYLIDLPKGDKPSGYDPNEYLQDFGKRGMRKLINTATEYSFSSALKNKLLVNL